MLTGNGPESQSDQNQTNDPAPIPELSSNPQQQHRIRVLLSDNASGGLAQRMTGPFGMTVGEFFRTNRVNVSGKKITVNGQSDIADDDILEDGDRISITHTKMDGN